MIMTEKQARDYANYLKVLASSAERLASDVLAHYDTWERWDDFQKCRKDLKNELEELKEFENQNEW